MSAVTNPADRPYANTACPYCDDTMTPLPKAKSRCRACGQTIYIRSGPDGFRYLLQEVDLPVLEAAWAESLVARGGDRFRAMQTQGVAWMAESLESYASAGIRRVQIIGADDPCSVCAAALAVDIYPIEAAPGYPIPGCTSELCRCDYIPVLD